MKTIKLLENGEPTVRWLATRRPASGQSILGPQPSRDEVALQAYYLYLGQGSPQGRDVEHWLEAEARLLSH